MTPKEKEAFYDAEIAPKLLELGRLCQEQEMAFLACVEFDPEHHGIGRTEYMPKDEKGKLSAAQRATHWAARCKGNIDLLVKWFLDHGKKHGHGSVYLMQLEAKGREYETRT